MLASPSRLDPALPVLDRLASAFRESLSAPVPYTPPKDRAPAYLMRLPMDDQIRIGRAKKFQDAALRTARSGNVPLARKLIARSGRQITPADMSERGYAIAIHFHLAVRAYIAYTDGKMTRARRDMTTALGWVNKLDPAQGDAGLDARRVHLARNLLRLDARDDHPVQAAQAALALLQYVAGDSTAWPYDDLQYPFERTSMTDAERHHMFDQVGRELALIFIHQDAAVWQSILARHVQEPHADPSRAVDASPMAEAMRLTYRWLAATKTRIEGSVEDFAAAAADVFEQGRSVPFIWVSTAREVVIACDEALEPAPGHASYGDGASASTPAATADNASSRRFETMRELVLRAARADRDGLDGVKCSIGLRDFSSHPTA